MAAYNLLCSVNIFFFVNWYFLGESVPVTKTPLPNVDNSVPWKIHSGEDYKRHVLFCGTEVIQTQASSKNLVKAVVLKTGM